MTAVTKESTCTECNALSSIRESSLWGTGSQCAEFTGCPLQGTHQSVLCQRNRPFCAEALLQDSLRTSSYPVFLEPRTSTEILVTSHTEKTGAICRGSRLVRGRSNELTGQCFTPTSQGPWELSSRNNARHLASFGTHLVKHQQGVHAYYSTTRLG